MPYARMLERPQFTDLAGLEVAAAKLPVMAKVPLVAKIDRQERPYTRRVAVYNTATQTIVGDVDPSFKLVQHADVVRKVGDGLRTLGLPFKGTTFSTPDGTYATAVVALLDDEAPDTAGAEKVGHVFQMAVEVRNALDASGAYTINGVAIRKVCGNGRVARDILGSWTARHTNGVEELLAATPQRVVDVVDRAGVYERFWRAADEEEVLWPDVPLLLKAAGLPERGINDIFTNLREFEPLARERLTRARLHEGASYWVNHHHRGDVRRGQALAEKIHILLEVEPEKLLAKITGAN